MVHELSDDFNLSTQFEWECRVLAPAKKAGLAKTEGLVRAQSTIPMSAADAALRFMLENKTADAGRLVIEVKSSGGSENYVVDGHWTLMRMERITSLGVSYKCTRREWDARQARSQAAGA